MAGVALNCLSLQYPFARMMSFLLSNQSNKKSHPARILITTATRRPHVEFHSGNTSTADAYRAGTYVSKMATSAKRHASKSGMRKISTTTKTFRPGKGGQLLPTDYYFDEEYFYEIQLDVKKSVPLSAITKVERDTIKVNNRSFWIVTYVVEGQTKQARFRHNYTLFNTAFADFLDAVKRANPEACVRELSAFSF
jgi:hypothetical protein